MDKSKSLKIITDSIEKYKKDVNAMFERGSLQPATQGDLEALSGEILYVFNDIKSAIESLS